MSIALVSTCPPRQCGIATFSRDLEGALQAADPAVAIQWAAINEPGSSHLYGSEVAWGIDQGNAASYREAALRLNAAPVDVVCLQHEFGLYGIWGEPFDDHLRGFLTALQKPLVTTLHSVLPNPTPSVRSAVQRLAERSSQVIVMADRASTLLVDVYGIAADKVLVIPHGVPPVKRVGRRRVKKQLDLAKHTIITTFGLVDPRKGIEHMIAAMAPISRRYPDALYLVIGKTHPDLVRRDGEKYRESLWQEVRERGLEAHVAFVNEYLTQAQIVDYLLATDIYVTPYVDPSQITSGTLAYALGAGKAIVSTPYLHAAEALADERGVLVGFRSASELAEATLRILDDPFLKLRLERNAYAYGRESAWPRVGERTLSVLRAAAADWAQIASPGLPEPSSLTPALEVSHLSICA